MDDESCMILNFAGLKMISVDGEESNTLNREFAGSGFTDNEDSEIVDREDSEIVDSKGSEVADSWNRELADSSARSGLSDVGGGVSRLFSKAGDSVCCSSWRSSNVTEELVEWARKPAGSNKRSGLSDVSGNAPRLFSKTGNSFRCSSWKSSTVAKEPVARALRERSKTKASNGEDSCEGRNTRSKGRGVSGARGDSETMNDEGSDDDIDFSDNTVSSDGEDSSL